MNVTKILFSFFLIGCLLDVQFSFSQSYLDFEVKTYQLKKSAVHAMRGKDYFSAIDFYEKYLERKSTDYKASFNLAELYRFTRDYQKALYQYKIALELHPEKNKLARYYIGRMQMTQEQYIEAIESLKQFRKEYKIKDKTFDFKKHASNLIDGCNAALGDTNNLKKIYVDHLKYGVNMAYNEAAPVPIEENKLLFASLRSDTIIHYNDSFYTDTSNFKSSFYVALKEKNDWEYEGIFEGPFIYNEFDVSNGCFSLDKQKFYFTKCHKNWKYNTICQIYYTELIDTKWSEPIKLNENINDKKFSSTQPCIGLNPKNGTEILYFSSNRKNGRGGFDLWYSEFKKNSFSEARNLGGRINTEGDEITPFFDVESSTLYFSSDGHPTNGELDIFKSFGNKSKWMKNPENLGQPINSPADDLYYSYGTNPKESFFTSNREGGMALKNPTCCDDIYAAIYDEFKRYIYKALVFSNETKEPISTGEIRVFMRDEESGDTTYLKTIEITSRGEVSIPVEADLNYLLIIESPDHFIRSLEIPPKNKKWDFNKVDSLSIMKLSKKSFVLENIYYEFDDYKLTKKAEEAIDSFLLKILFLNPEIEVEISSHTDAKGGNEYNISLSQKRAESVIQYLKKKGISSSRLVAKGYGKTQPIAPNVNSDGSDNPEGRALNRRTEFKVIGFEHKIRYKKIQSGLNAK